MKIICSKELPSCSQYGATIIELSGSEDVHASIWMSIVPTAANFLTTIVALMLFNKLNRRTLLFFSCIGRNRSVFFWTISSFRHDNQSFAALIGLQLPRACAFDR